MSNSPDSFKFSDFANGIGIGALLLIVVGTLFIRDPAVPPVRLPTPAAPPSVSPSQDQPLAFADDARMLAQVDGDPANAASYSNVLKELSTIYGDGEPSIVTSTLLAQSQLKQAKIDQPLLPLLQAMTVLFPRGTKGLKYDNYLSSYVTFRKSKSHEEAVAEIAALVRAQANPGALTH